MTFKSGLALSSEEVMTHMILTVEILVLTSTQLRIEMAFQRFHCGSYSASLVHRDAHQVHD
jgi:hypothetical protein